MSRLFCQVKPAPLFLEECALWDEFPEPLALIATTPLTRAEIEDALRRYGPRIVFHPDEPYKRCRVEHYLASAVQLVIRDGMCVRQHPVATVEEGGELKYHPDFTDAGSIHDYIVAGPSMEGQNVVGKPTGQVVVDCASCTRGYTSEMAEGDVNHAKVYVNVKWWPGRTYTDLQIWVFFAMNGPGSIRLLGKSTRLSHQGRHQADWEKVTLRVSNAPGTRGQPLGVFLSQHGEAEFVPTSGKLTVYSSRNGHAMFAAPGTHFTEERKLCGLRVFGVENVAADGGVILDTAAAFELVESSYACGNDGVPIVLRVAPWLRYQGRWGPREHFDDFASGKEIAKGVPCVGWCCWPCITPITRMFTEKWGAGPTTLQSKSRYYGPEHPELSPCRVPSVFDDASLEPTEPYVFAVRSESRPFSPQLTAYDSLLAVSYPAVLEVLPAVSSHPLVIPLLHLSLSACRKVCDVVTVRSKRDRSKARFAAIWRPTSPDVMYLGDVFHYGGAPGKYAVSSHCLHRDVRGQKLFVPPVRMLPVTKEWRVTSTTTVSVWQPEAPEGYVSLGHVVCVGALTSADALRSVVERDSGSPLMCVLREAIVPASHSQAWQQGHSATVLCYDNPIGTFRVHAGRLFAGSTPVMPFGELNAPGFTFASAAVHTAEPSSPFAVSSGRSAAGEAKEDSIDL